MERYSHQSSNQNQHAHSQTTSKLSSSVTGHDPPCPPHGLTTHTATIYTRGERWLSIKWFYRNTRLISFLVAARYFCTYLTFVNRWVSSGWAINTDRSSMYCQSGVQWPRVQWDALLWRGRLCFLLKSNPMSGIAIEVEQNQSAPLDLSLIFSAL